MNGAVRIRRRPGYGEAIRFNGDNADIIADWAGPDATYEGGRLVIHTAQGDMTPDLGNWVVYGLADKPYPMTTKDFEAGWEVIDR